jgi:predicted transcriptional regulator
LAALDFFSGEKFGLAMAWKVKTEGRPERTPLDAELMQILWERRDATPAEVARALEGKRPLAPKTIHTIVAYLLKKGYLRLVPTVERSLRYAPCIPRAQMGGRRVQDLLRDFFGGVHQRLMTHLKSRTSEMRQVRCRFAQIALLCLFSSGFAFGQTTIDTIAHQPDPVGPYSKLEITFNLQRAYTNKYDTGEVDARVEFVPPGGGPMTLPAFWYLGYNRTYSGGTEYYSYDGTATWMARLMPRAEGTYSYRVLVTDGGGDSASDWQTFECSGPGKPGVIRVDSRNPMYLRYENGEPYFPVGHNLCWPGGGGAYRIAEWLTRMEDAGENWTRYWMVPYVGQGLEWSGSQYLGLGKYSQRFASRFDGMIDAAVERGVAVQFCIDSFNGWNQTTYANWEENPYSTARGGMLSNPRSSGTRRT